MTYREQIALSMENALGHIGAYLEGGDEMGIVSDEDASEAYTVICNGVTALVAEVARLRAELAAVDAVLGLSDGEDRVEFLRELNSEIKNFMTRNGYESDGAE